MRLKSKSQAEQGGLQTAPTLPGAGSHGSKLQTCFWENKAHTPHPQPHGPSELSPGPSPQLIQFRPYLLLLAASSSLIFLMSLLHFSISTTFSPSTGDKEKQGGYHGYTGRTSQGW